MKCEILAPVGQLDQISHIIEAGADAIYVGLSDSSARPKEADFSLEDIKKARELTKKANIQLYVAVNGSFSDNRIYDLYPSLLELEKIGIDALIVSDFGLIKYYHDSNISIPLHASTLTGIYNTEAVDILKEYKITRIILSSDLYVTEIASITRNNKDLEFEIVADGGVCFNSNRQCLLPHMNTMESYQVFCQLDYVLVENGKVIGDAKRIGNCPAKIHRDMGIYVGLGISSFKIEGRTNPLWYIIQRTKEMKESRDVMYRRENEIPGYMHYIVRNATWS